MKQYLGSLSTITVIAVALSGPVAIANADGLVYAYDMRNNRAMYKFNKNDPGNTRTIFGGPGLAWRTYAMDFDLFANNLYVLENLELPFGGTNNIGTVDLTTGAVNYIAQVTGDAAGLSLGGMAFSPDGNVYASTGGALYTLNIATGVSTFVANFSGGGTFVDIAVDNNGVMYGHSITNNALYTIDTSTGEVNLVGSHGLSTSFAQGMGFDRSTNELYATLYTGGGGGWFVRWDTTDGSIDQIFDTSVWGSGAEMTMAIKSAIPGPGALALLGLAGLAGVRRRRN